MIMNKEKHYPLNISDFDKLALVSDVAEKHISDPFEIITIFDFDCSRVTEVTFHPNGKCGCLILSDDYLFDIRCDHLMWADGVCECTESFWTDKDRAKEEWNDAIFIYGNHKGNLKGELIIFHEV